MKIRAITKDDYPVLGRMWEEFELFIASLETKAAKSKSIDGTAALKRLDLLEHGGAGLIAEQNGKAVGYLLYFPSASMGTLERTMYMADFFVRSKFRGKGIGKKLMLALCEKAKDRRVTSLMWTVYDRNPKAMEFYYKLGAHVIRDDMIMAWEVPKAGRKRTSSAKLKKSRA